MKFAQRGVRIATWTDVPRQSGLGGSSLFVLLCLAGLREFYDLDRQVHNDYLLAELTQRVEAKDLGITCGFADRYVPLFGGVAYLDYRGKLHHKPLGQEPYVTYERLDAYVDDLPLVLASTGVIRDSGDVHGAMRPRYLEEEYVRMIAEFGLDGQEVYDRASVQMAVRDDQIEPSVEESACHNERREQEPIGGSPAPAFPLR